MGRPSGHKVRRMGRPVIRRPQERSDKSWRDMCLPRPPIGRGALVRPVTTPDLVCSPGLGRRLDSADVHPVIAQPSPAQPSESPVPDALGGGGRRILRRQLCI